MDSLRQYLLSLTASAVICGIITAMFPGKGASQKLVKLLSGLMLTIAALQPVSRLDIAGFLDDWKFELSQGEYAGHEGENLARDAMAEIIKENTEAYILDKAVQLGLQITAEVTLTGDDIPQPKKVTIRGYASPYAKSQLMQIIADDLGISKEDQTWTAQP